MLSRLHTARSRSPATLWPSFARSLSNTVDAVLDSGSVNYFFTRICNYGCKFCFHTRKSEESLPLKEMQRALDLLAEAKVAKINFAGGEPFLFPEELAALVKHAKSLGMYTSVTCSVSPFPAVPSLLSRATAQVISNGSLIKPGWMAANAQHLDMLGVSFDTASDEVNFQHGRWPAGGTLPAARSSGRSRAERHLLRACSLAREHGVDVKVNTVVTSKNADECVAPVINEARPSRWKVFQVLALEGENCGEGALSDVAPLLLSRERYDAYVARNRAALEHPDIMKE